MHIFLTGPKNIGKTTIIKKVTNYLKQNYDINISGLQTYKGINDNYIYISPWSNNKYARVIGIKQKDNLIHLTKTFETIGVKILENTKNSQLIVIDELGFLEEHAFIFQNACLDLLKQNTPILGVIKQKKVNWLEKIKSHPKVEIMTVTKQNRDELVYIITDKIKNILKKLLP